VTYHLSVPVTNDPSFDPLHLHGHPSPVKQGGLSLVRLAFAFFEERRGFFFDWPLLFVGPWFPW